MIPIYEILEVINYFDLMWLYSHGDTLYFGSFGIHLNFGLVLDFFFFSLSFFSCLIIFLFVI